MHDVLNSRATEIALCCAWSTRAIGGGGIYNNSRISRYWRCRLHNGRTGNLAQCVFHIRIDGGMARGLSWSRVLWRSVFRIADHVRTDIDDRPCWTMSLSGPSLLQNARSTSRRSVSPVGKETFPDWVSRSVQMASRDKDGRSKPIFKTPRLRPDGP